jgi:hypothetical protein
MKLTASSPKGGSMTVQSFTNFTTNVTGDLKPDGTVNRSADGSTITGVAAQGLGVGPVRALVVATNATEYDQGGNLEAEGLDHLGLVNLETQEIEDQFVSAQVSLAGTFQPITDTVNPVIPLPAGVWAGWSCSAGRRASRAGCGVADTRCHTGSILNTATYFGRNAGLPARHPELSTRGPVAT